MADWTNEPLEAMVEVVAVATLPVAALAAIFVGGDAAGVVAIVGWLFLVPTLSVLSDHVDLGEDTAEESPVEATTDDSTDDALQGLRQRYAAGEIDDSEFERRLERLIETEDVEVRGEVALDERGSDPIGTDRAGTDSERRERELE